MWGRVYTCLGPVSGHLRPDKDITITQVASELSLSLFPCLDKSQKLLNESAIKRKAKRW